MHCVPITGKHADSCCLFMLADWHLTCLSVQWWFFSVKVSCMVEWILIALACVCLVLVLHSWFLRFDVRSEHHSLMQASRPTVHDFYVTDNAYKDNLASCWAYFFQEPQKIITSIPILRVLWNWCARHSVSCHPLFVALLIICLMSVLMFMFIYAKSDKAMCAMREGIDIKMMHKCIKPYVDALFELNYEVVSDVSLVYFNTTHFLMPF